MFLSTNLSVKPRCDSPRPSFSAVPVLPQCTGKPTQDIPLRPFSPANPRGYQPTLCCISLGMIPHDSAAELGGSPAAEPAQSVMPKNSPTPL